MMPVEHTQRRKWWKTTLIVVAAVLFATVAGAVMVSYFFEDKIKQTIVDEINAQLTTRVDVGDINFSLLRHFPHASVEFTRVCMHPCKPFNEHDTLMFASRVYLLFNVFDLLGNNYHINSCRIHEGMIRMITDKQGHNNFDIVKHTQKPASPGMSVTLEDIELENTLYSYIDNKDNESYSLLAHNASLELKYSDNLTAVAGTIRSTLYTIKWSSDNFIDSLSAVLHVDLAIHDNGNRIVINPSVVELKGTTLQTQGVIKSSGVLSHIDMVLNSTEADLLSLMSLVPVSQRQLLAPYESAGAVTFTCMVKGAIGPEAQPDIDCNFDARDATFSHKENNVALKKIKLKGSYTNHYQDKQGADCIWVKDFSCMLNEGNIKAHGTINNFAKPLLSIEAEGKLDLAQLKALFALDTIETAKGQVMAKIKFTGTLADKNTYRAAGHIQVTDGMLKLKNGNNTWEKFRAILNIDDNSLQIEQCDFAAGGSDFSFKGACDNFPGCIFTGNKNIRIQSSLTCNNLILDEFVHPHSGDNTKEDSTPVISLPAWFQGSLILSIKNLQFRKFTATNIVGNVDCGEGTIAAQNLRLQAFDGVVMLEGRIDASQPDHVAIVCDAGISKINIAKLLTETANFGQTVITDKNVKGIADATVQISTWWSPTLQIDLNKIVAISDVTITRGELNDFEPLQALKKYVKGADFKNIKFETLENQIQISKGAIVIPNMDIRSTAMNLTASGTHSFDNMVDYKIKIQMSELLGRKVKSLNTEFGIIEEDGLGKPNIFINMKGPINNPVVKYDRKSVEQHIANSAKQEQKNLKVILNKEFGWFKKDSTITRQNPATDTKKKKADLIIDTDPF